MTSDAGGYQDDEYGLLAWGLAFIELLYTNLSRVYFINSLETHGCVPENVAIGHCEKYYRSYRFVAK